MYAIDPELSAHLGELEATDVSNVDAAKPEPRTTAIRTRRSAIEKPVKVRDARVAGRAGQPVAAMRIDAPPHTTTRHGGLPCVRGGGFVLGDLDMADAVCAGCVGAAGIVVVSVDCRLAPELPFPVGLDDCFLALRRMIEHGAEPGVDPARVDVMGESAGGGLGASLTYGRAVKGKSGYLDCDALVTAEMPPESASVTSTTCVTAGYSRSR